MTSPPISGPRLGDRPRLQRRLAKRLKRRAPTPAELERIEAGRRAPAPPPAAWLWGMAAVMVVGALQLGLAGLDAMRGTELGGACIEHHDCESGLCLKHLERDARYCSQPCEGPGQCGPQFDCGSAAHLPHAQHGVGAAGPRAQGPVCVLTPR